MIVRRTLSMSLSLALALFLLAPVACKKKDLSDAVATVNGQPVSKKKFELARESMLRRLGGTAMSGAGAALANDPQMAKLVLDNLIGVELLFQEAEKQGYSASPEAVDRTVTAFRTNYPTPEAFEKDLQDKGVSEKMLREDVGRQLVIERFIDQGLGVAAPTAEEVRKFYDENAERLRQPEQVRASHILVKVAADASEEQKKNAEAKARSLAAKAKKGADFAELAKANSDDGSAAAGGDLGLFPRGRMVRSFDDAAFSLKVGQVSDPVLSQFGWHVIKVTAHKAPSAPDFEEVRPSLTDYLKGMKTQEVLEKKVADLRAAAKVETLIDLSAPAPAESGKPAE